jgi:uncharacterized membrane protein YdjX (TVP38/TMEM64 family)
MPNGTKRTAVADAREDKNALGMPKATSGRPFWRSPFFLAVFFTIALLVVLALPQIIKAIPWMFDQGRLTMQLKMLGPWAAVIFIGVYGVSTMLAIPCVILTLVGGVWFGLFWGSLWSAMGATLGAMGAFGLARSLLHDWVQHRFEAHPLLVKFNQATAQNPFSFILMVRFAPISPFTVVNFLFGLTKISGWVYTLGTLVGILPWVITYTWLGVAGQQTLQGGSPIPLAIAGSILTLMSAFPLLRRKSFNRGSGVDAK